MKLEVKKVDTSESLVECPPELSADGEHIFIPAGKILRVFRNDGQFFCNLTGPKGNITHVTTYQHTVTAVCSLGQVSTWSFLDHKLISTINLWPPVMSKREKITKNVGEKTFKAEKASKTHELFQYFHNKDIGLSVAVFRPKDDTSSSTLAFEVSKGNSMRFLFKDVQNGYNKVAIGGHRGAVVAAIKDCSVCVEDLISKKTKRHMTDERKFTCVALHPNENVLATSDITGRIIIWHDFIDSSYPPKAECHWHTLPVSSIRFTSEGSYLLSGGGECALVKWQLRTHTKTIVPRLGAPIKFISVSDDGSSIAITSETNCINLLLGTTGEVMASIQGVIPNSRAHLMNGETIPNPAGLMYHPLTKTIISNAQSGHVQLQKLTDTAVHQNLDVTQQNYITDERQTAAVNTDVVRVALSKDNRWLATVEHWEDPLQKMSPELTIKTWKFDGVQFLYNSVLYMPHDDEIKNLLFAPFPGDYPILITTGGRDNTFKVWKQKEEDRVRPVWICSFIGRYKDMPCNYADFSFDSSLLAVAFGKVVTCWSFKTLIGLLSTHLIKSDYQQLAFSQREETSQLLAGITHDQVLIWHIISARVIRHIDISVGIQRFFADRESDRMAVVTKSNELFVFTPDRVDAAVMKKLDFTVIGGCLIAKPSNNQSAMKSRVVLLSQSKEMFIVDDSFADDYTWAAKSQIEKVRFTPFASLKNKKETDVKQVKSHFDKSSDVSSFLNTYVNEPSITLPPTTAVFEVYENLLLLRAESEVNAETLDGEAAMDVDIAAAPAQVPFPDDDDLCRYLCDILLS